MKNRITVNARAVRSSAALSEQMVELPDGMWNRIAQKAYELYEQRGQREGFALQDWLDAEDIVMEEIHEARE
jgi:hypothetical protein